MAYKCRRGAVPCCIASCLKGGAKTAGREGGCVWLSLDQLFSGKAHENLAVVHRCGDKCVMFLCSNSCQRLEPVAVMSGTLFNGPFFHLMCDHISNLHGKLLAFLDGFLQFLVDFLRQTFLHDGIIEYVASK